MDHIKSLQAAEAAALTTEYDAFELYTSAAASVLRNGAEGHSTRQAHVEWQAARRARRAAQVGLITAKLGADEYDYAHDLYRERLQKLRGEAAADAGGINLHRVIRVESTLASIRWGLKQSPSTATTVVVYGPAGCGKTHNAEVIARALGLTVVVDWWEGRRPVSLPETGVLALTTSQPSTPHRAMSYVDAMNLVALRDAEAARAAIDAICR